MVFIVETGVGLYDSNSYASVVEFTSYHADRGTMITDVTSVTSWLIRAADYLDGVLADCASIAQARTGQAMQFPRRSEVATVLRDGETESVTATSIDLPLLDTDVITSGDSIPVLLKQAQIEYAAYVAAGVELDPRAAVSYTHLTLPTILLV